MPIPPRFSVHRSEIAGFSVSDLARQFGTPVYVYDAAKIVERIHDLRAFDVVRYAQKACSNLAILDLVRRHGALVDAVSEGEVRRALAAGYVATGDPPPIVYTADIFDRESLELAVQLGLHVNCGSPEMIDQLGQRVPGSNITLRINPGFGHGHSQKTNTGGQQSKHGIWHEQLSDCLRRADHYGLAVTGLHMHIGSGTDLAHLAQVAGAMEQAAAEAGRGLHMIGVGGGLPVPYREGQEYVDLDAYFQLWDATRRRLAERFGHALRLEIEPGRYLVAESGYLVTEIRTIKRMGENTFYLVDAGFNNLARPILYGAYHPMSIARAAAEKRGHATFPDENQNVPFSTARAIGDSASGAISDPQLVEVIVGGPLCESGDIFTQEEGGYVSRRKLPAARVGDYLVIECAGAYGFVMGSNYNSKPLAAEVLIDGGRSHLIRERQTFEDLIRGERIPG